MKTLFISLALAFATPAAVMRVTHVDRSDTEYLKALAIRKMEADAAWDKGVGDMKEKYHLEGADDFSDDFTHAVKYVEGSK